MKATGHILAAVLVAGLVALPAGAQPSENDNWHVHDGGASDVALRKAPTVFFPAIFSQEGETYDPVNDPALCPDATDKEGTLHNGEHTNRHHVNGICTTSAFIIHLRSAAGGSEQVPPDWGSVVWNGSTYHYRLSPRG